MLILEAVVRFSLVDRLFLASPSLIAAAAWEKLVSGELIAPFVTTIYEVAVTFIFAGVAGLFGGYLLWRYPVLGKAYDDLLGALFASPLILVYPIFLVAFGRNTAAIIAMAFLTGTIPIILNTHQGLRDVSEIYIKVGESFRLTQRQMVRHVLFPAAFPAIVAGLKLGLTYILISVIALEFLIEIGGIGTIASKGYFWFNTEELYLGVVGAVLLSMLFVYLLARVEARLLGHE
ncbi:MAG: ABC transporter permease subunit [Deltaproteobacteria bacterium]|nr:ABC transporter permease subunit [Deltaproteobacteria bacterium]